MNFRDLLVKKAPSTEAPDACADNNGAVSNAAICEELLDTVESKQYVDASKQRAMDSGLYTPEEIEYLWG